MDNLKERIYAGLIGKSIGVRLGAPVESSNWTRERILGCFGEIDNYLKDSEKFAADDDTNGPIFFSRAIFDYGKPLTPEKISATWLNYTRPYQGMFWWGGEGISTEHTAYNRLVSGLEAPESGSAKINGVILSNQVGGQIFVDSWGLINLGNIDKAMQDSAIAASVSHDLDGVIGAKFIAGCIAGAVYHTSTKDLIKEILGKLDSNSEYVRVMLKLYNFYIKNPDDYNLAYKYVEENFGYSKYPGACHIIPNACLVLIGLLYSNNKFNKAIEITTMCGWDTDSNAGVVGTIMGVMNGLKGIDWKYREAINDILICSSFSPDLNLVNIVDYTNFLWSIRTEKEYIPNKISFEFSGSTNGLQIYNDFRLIRDKISKETSGSYNVLIDNLVKGDLAKIYFQTYYRKEDFPDDRYQPVIMPQAYPGDQYIFEVSCQYFSGKELLVQPFIELVNGKSIFIQNEVILKNNENTNINFSLPHTNYTDIHKTGLMLSTKVESVDGCGLLGRFNIKQVRKINNTKTKIKFRRQDYQFCDNINPFSNSNIKTSIQNGMLKIESGKKFGISVTGKYYSKKQNIKTNIVSLTGVVLRIGFKVKGLVDFYSFDIYKDYIILFRKKHSKEKILKKVRYKRPENFSLELKVNHDYAELVLNDKTVISTESLENNFGHIGFGGKDVSFYMEEMDLIYQE